MQLHFDLSAADGFTSNAQKARVLTENWVASNMYCPECGNPKLVKIRNNEPVKDFSCERCLSSYELKSKSSVFSSEIPDGAYATLIGQIEKNENPDFMFLHYNKQSLLVENMFVVPKHFFTPNVIKQRKPLSSDAQRSGWVGCNILLSQIPAQGRILIIEDGHIIPINDVIVKFSKTKFLEKTNINQRGWVLDIINCINRLDKRDFSLDEVYHFENELANRHPDNRNIKAKIRQQLQILRDRDLLQFNGNGNYSLV